MDHSGLATIEECLWALKVCQSSAQDQLAACLIDADDNVFRKAACHAKDAYVRTGCMAKFTACLGSDPKRVCGAALCVAGAAICCADTPAPGPADCIGGPIVACGMLMICPTEEGGNSPHE